MDPKHCIKTTYCDLDAQPFSSCEVINFVLKFPKKNYKSLGTTLPWIKAFDVFTWAGFRFGNGMTWEVESVFGIYNYLWGAVFCFHSPFV
jgi:hypothetical protein